MNRKLTYLLSILFLFTASLHAQVYDFDSDGLTDIVVTEKNGGSHRWSYYSSSSNFQSKVEVIAQGEAKATPILGQWATANALTPGTIRLKRSGGKRQYVWNIFGSEIALGGQNSRIAVGFDINSNSLTDFLIISKSGLITIYNDHFSSSTTSTLRLGKSIARNGFPIVLDNLGTKLIGFARAKRSSSSRKVYTVKTKDLAGNSFNINLGREPGTLFGAYGIATTGTDPNAVLLVLRRSSGFRMVIKDFERNTIASSNFRGNLRKISVANFGSGAGDEIFYATKNGKFVVNLQDSSFSTLDLSDVISENVRQELTIIQRDQPSSSSSGGAGISSVCSSTSSLPAGVLWKPDSDVSDNRGGKPVVLFQGSRKPGTGSIKIYATNGQQIGLFTFKAPNESGINGNSDHYYSGWVGGSGETGGQLGAEATAATGNHNVYFQGRGGLCYGPVNPDGRSGGLF